MIVLILMLVFLKYFNVRSLNLKWIGVKVSKEVFFLLLYDLNIFYVNLILLFDKNYNC